MVQSLGSGSAYQVEVSVEGVVVQATVDTAAEATIISNQLFERLGNKYDKRKEVIKIMYTAGKDQTLPAFLIGPVCIDLGPLSTKELIYVAPIQDDMLLGMDFHRKHATTIDFKRDVILVKSQAIHIAPRKEQEVYSSYQFFLSEEVSIPANSVANTLCSAELETGMEYVIEREDDLSVLSPRVLVEGSTDQQFSVCLVNISDREISLDSGTVVGNAFPILEQVQRRVYDTIYPVVRFRRIACKNAKCRITCRRCTHLHARNWTQSNGNV